MTQKRDLSAELEEFQELADRVLRSYGCQPVQVKWHHEYPDLYYKKGLIGRAHLRERVVTLNSEYTNGTLQDAIRHEIAHFLAYDIDKSYKHDRVWRKWARRMNCNPRAKQFDAALDSTAGN